MLLCSTLLWDPSEEGVKDLQSIILSKQWKRRQMMNGNVASKV